MYAVMSSEEHWLRYKPSPESRGLDHEMFALKFPETCPVTLRGASGGKMAHMISVRSSKLLKKASFLARTAT